MMTKFTSRKVLVFKQIALLPIAAIATFLFSANVVVNAQAQTDKTAKQQQKQNASNPPAWTGKSIGFTREGVSQELLDEYESIVNKYKTPDNKWWQTFPEKISPTDWERLETIYKQMNKQQQALQLVAFIPPFRPSAKVTPTTTQLQDWKNEKIYGVWIDQKRVSNSVLDNFSTTDFANFFVSKLEKNAINYGKHYYQINLMTKDYYEEYYATAIADKKNRMVFRIRKTDSE